MGQDGKRACRSPSVFSSVLCSPLLYKSALSPLSLFSSFLHIPVLNSSISLSQSSVTTSTLLLTITTLQYPHSRTKYQYLSCPSPVVYAVHRCLGPSPCYPRLSPALLLSLSRPALPIPTSNLPS